MRFLSTMRHPDPRQVRREWEKFLDAGTRRAVHVRPYVLRAWKRSRDAGCDPHLARAEVLGPAATAELLARHSRLVEIAEPFLAALSRAAGADRHAAMLADAEGRLLRVVGDEETVADENFPRAGSLLSESTSGANGVGTAVAENGYVELVGPEHYIEGFHAFTCQGVPVAGPAPERAGVISMSVRRLETADRVRDILFCASEAAQCELLASWLGERASAGVDNEVALERLRQDMVQRITMVRLRLELAARQIATGVDATSTIDAARALSRKFRRESAIWSSLAIGDVSVPRPERIDLAESVGDFIDLLQTEARILSVHLGWGAAERVAILEGPRVLARRLLSGFLTAMQAADPGTELIVDVGPSGTVGHLRIRDGARSLDLFSASFVRLE